MQGFKFYLSENEVQKTKLLTPDVQIVGGYTKGVFISPDDVIKYASENPNGVRMVIDLDSDKTILGVVDMHAALMGGRDSIIKKTNNWLACFYRPKDKILAIFSEHISLMLQKIWYNFPSRLLKQPLKNLLSANLIDPSWHIYGVLDELITVSELLSKQTQADDVTDVNSKKVAEAEKEAGKIANLGGVKSRQQVKDLFSNRFKSPEDSRAWSYRYGENTNIG